MGLFVLCPILFLIKCRFFAGHPETFHMSVTHLHCEELSTPPDNYLYNLYIYLIYGCSPYMSDQQEKV